MSRPQRCGFLSLLYSVGDKPLNLWSKHISLDGRIRRVEDQALRGDKVMEIMGPLQTPVPTNITCPSVPTDVLNIKLPILVLVIKNLELMFKLEFQLIDKKLHRRQFCLTTQSNEKPQLTHTNTVSIPLKLDEGWNNLEINLQTLCTKAHGSDFQAIQRIIIYPNCRLRRVYFQDRHYGQDETPVELCQAFFDMYMLKWGIHLVERSCQTEELYTGPLQPCDLEYFATDSDMSVSVTTTSLPYYEDIRMNQIKQAMGKDIGVSMSLGNSKTVVMKKSSKSVYQLGKKPETSGSCQLKLISNGVKSTHAMDKRKVNEASNSSTCKKDKKQSEHKTKKSKEGLDVKDKSVGSESQVQSLRFKDEKGTVKLFPHIVKSQYLKSQIGENFSNSNCQKNVDNMLDSHACSERPKSNQKVGSKARAKVIEKLNSNGEIDSINLDSKLATSKLNSVASPKIKCLQNLQAKIDVSVKNLKPDSNAQNDLRKVEKYHGDGLLSHSVRAIEEVINEVQKIREQLINYDMDRRLPSEVAKEAVNDLPHDVPPVVEVQAISFDERSKKTVLSTDKAVCDFLELRHAVNKKILGRLKDKGLTITEVELSIYNSKNRRNCYGQGKLIESGIGCTSKASGLSSVAPLKMDISLRKEQLSLNDKICLQLRNELDATLLQLKSTQVRVTPKVVEDTIGNIVKEDCRNSSSAFFSVNEAQCIKKKVYNENMLKQDTETGPRIQHLENDGGHIRELIENLDKYSGAEIVNVLFQRQMYDSEVEFNNITSSINV